MVTTNNVKQLNNETHKITDEEKTDQTKFNKFCDRFHINPNLISLKLCLFLLYGATSSLLPYLTIHMQSIGLTVEEIATVYLALPFTTFLAPPLTGFMLDKFGRYKPIVIVSMLLNAIIHHSLLFIPHQELPGIMPAAYVIRHNISGYVEVWWSPCPSRECPEEDELDMVIDRCVDHCLLHQPINPRIQVIPKPPLSVATNPVKNGDVAAVPDVGEIDDLVFHLGNTKRKPMKSSSAFFEIDLHPDLAEPPEQLGIEMQKDENDTVTEFTDRFDEAFLFRSGINITELNEEDLRCGGELKAINSLYMDRLKELTADCLLQKCNFREGGPEICPPDYKESDDATFYVYFLLRFLATVVQLTTVTIVDPIALTMIQKYGGDFGRERLFSSLGMAIFSPITGILIDLSSKNAGYTDYSAAFYTYDILLALSAFTVLAMPLGEKLPNDNLFRDLIKIMTLPHVVLFIFFLFVLGNFWGFIESFLFLYLKELGAPNYMLGITVTVGTVSSMPFLYGAEKIIKKIGHVNIFIIAFFSHAVRLVGYSFIESAWWCFPFEAMESLSVHLMWVAAATYCAILAPKNLLATLIGILGMAHFSIGRGSGSFVGGFLIGNFGTRESFRYMGILAVAGGILYGILHVLWLKKYEQDDKDDDTAGDDTADVEEIEKLNIDNETQDNPSQRSIERLSLIIEYNQIGSLTSLARGSKSDIRERVYVLRTRSSSTRRSSYNLIEIIRTPRGSASKVDMLKSALEIHNSKQSLRTHTVLSRNHSASIRLSSKDNLNIRTLSAPKLIQKNSLSHLNNIDLERCGRRSSIPEEAEENLDEKQKYQKERSASNENVNTKDKHGQK